MLEQFHPKRFVVRERYKFWAEIRRKPGETIQDLAARIRQDAVTCNFSSITNPQDEAMRTRFICSCENEAVLKALFKIKDDDLSFSRAIEIATQIEDAAKCAKETVYGTSTVSAELRDNSVSFEVDTGAGDNFICSEIWHQMGKPPLQPVTSRFESASGHPLPVLGSFQEKIKVEGTKPTLINLDFELDIKFKVDAKPVFCKPRTVPLAVQNDLEKAYDAGIAKGIWKPTTFSSYGTPVVLIRKKALQGQTKAQIRVCGDYSVTVNPQLETHRHLISKPEDLMRRLGGGHYFSKIDLADAYNQIQLSPASQEKLALSTHRGVLLQQRLPFGITSAPGYFQEVMDQLTYDLPGVAVYIDDCLVSGTDADSHLQNLRRLL
ncbi:hypothetical protein RRG08_058147 [Elysia crispata]|uniref:Reverse transcriptase domain-containing protein n=1 Tax=Elysia crispata TaxID=231223 RepID=A0AAE0Y2P0_9GAST|nr:hypothetical protein RRG08_058147 [Elysia crispata]